MQSSNTNTLTFLISNFRHILSIVCNLLGISPASDYTSHLTTSLWRWNR